MVFCQAVKIPYCHNAIYSIRWDILGPEHTTPQGSIHENNICNVYFGHKEGKKPWLRVLAIVFLATKSFHFCHCHLVGQVQTWFKLKTTWIGHQYTFSNQSFKEERRRLRIFYYLQHADKLLLYCLQIYPRPKTLSSVAFFCC